MEWRIKVNHICFELRADSCDFSERLDRIQSIDSYGRKQRADVQYFAVHDLSVIHSEYEEFDLRLDSATNIRFESRLESIGQLDCVGRSIHGIIGATGVGRQ